MTGSSTAQLEHEQRGPYESKEIIVHKPKSVFSAAVALTAAVALSACGGAAGASGGNGTAAGNGGDAPAWQGVNHLPAQVSWSRAFENVTDFLAEEGIANTTLFHQEALLAGTDVLSGVAAGQANIGILQPLYNPGELPLTNVASIPFVSQDPEAHAHALNELYRTNEAFRAEYEKSGVHLIAVIPVSAGYIATAEEIDGLEGLKGKSIRAAGMLADTMDLMGANPISISAGEIYQSTEQGLLDGYTSYAFDIAIRNSLHEVAPHVIDAGFGVYGISAVIMNKRNWDDLTDEQRQTIDDAVDSLVTEGAKLAADDITEACTTMFEAGGTAKALSDSELAQVKERVGDSQIEGWKKAATSAGLSADVVDGFYEDLLSELQNFEGTSENDLSLSSCIASQG